MAFITTTTTNYKLLSSVVLLVITMVLRISSTSLPWYQSTTLSEQEAQEILDAHNHFRNSVRPLATNMIKMEWNKELSYIAHFWAANCVYQENEDRHSQSTDFDYVGEILGYAHMYYSSNLTVNYTAIVEIWYNVGSRYDYYSGTCLNEDGKEEEEGGCSEYTQLVWARSWSVGCGIYHCEELEDLDWEDEENEEDRENEEEEEDETLLFLVCDYGPGGSFADKKPYKTGSEPCHDCDRYHPICEGNLCVEEDNSGTPLRNLIQIQLVAAFLAVIASPLFLP